MSSLAPDAIAEVISTDNATHVEERQQEDIEVTRRAEGARSQQKKINRQ